MINQVMPVMNYDKDENGKIIMVIVVDDDDLVT